MRRHERAQRIGVAFAALVVACAASARADGDPPPPAEALFREGREAMKRGDYAVACPKFEESQKLDPANGTLLNLALCEEALGHPERARELLRDVLAASDLDEQRRAIAAEHAAALERTTKIPEREAVAPSSPLPSPPQERTASPPSPPPPERDTQPPKPTSPHASVYVLGSLGILSLATSAVTGILVIDKADTVNAHCPNKLCDDEGLAAASSGRTLSAVSTATFGVGVALTALSAYFLLQPSPSAPKSAVTLTGVRGGTEVRWVREF